MWNKYVSLLATIVFVPFVFGLMGCSRSGSKTAQITINLPSAIQSRLQSQASSPLQRYGLPGPVMQQLPTSGTPQLVHAVINVTSTDLPAPVVMIWDASNMAGAIAPSATGVNFSVNVPYGSGRLFQALLVFKDDTGGMTFYYGDVTADVGSATDSVSIYATLQGTSTAQAMIAGRYLTAADYGPTGHINMYYTPTGKPAMIVDRTEIYGGWFNVFALTDIPFTYVATDLNNQTTMFGGPVDTASFGSGGTVAPTGSVAYDFVNLTWSLYTPQGGNSCTPWSPCSGPMSGLAVVAGFFGPGVSTQKACYWNSTGSQFIGAYKDTNGLTPVYWSGTSGPVAMYGSSNGTDSGTISDPSGTNSICSMTSLQQYTNYISLDENQLLNRSSVIDTDGPYVTKYSGSSPSSLSVNYSGTYATLTYQYLPGVISSSSSPTGIDGTDFFYRQLPAGMSNMQDYRAENGIACDLLTSLPMPFTFLVERPVSALNGLTTDTNYSTPLLSSVIQSSTGQFQIVGCPYRMLSSVKQYFHGAAEWDGGNNGGGGGQSGGPAVQFELTDLTGAAISTATVPGVDTIEQAVCTPVILQALDSTGQPTMAPSASNITATFGGSLTLSTNPSCTLPLTSGATLGSPSNLNGGYILYALISSGSATLSFADAIDNSPYGLQVSANIAAGPLTGGHATSLLALGPPTIFQYACYPLVALAYDSNKLLNTFSTAPTITWPGVPGVTYYSDSNCTVAVSSNGSSYAPSTSTGVEEANVYFSYTGPTANVPLAPAVGGASLLNASFAATAWGPGSPNRIQINMPGSVYHSTMIGPIGVQIADSNGNATPPLAATTVTVTSTAGGLFCTSTSTTSCTCTPTSSTGTLTFSATSPSNFYLCYMAPATAGVMDSIGASSTTGLNGSTKVNIN